MYINLRSNFLSAVRTAAAVCLMVGAAFALAQKKARPAPQSHLQVHALTQQSLRQLQQGNKLHALGSLKAAQQLVLQQPGEFSTLESTRLNDLISGFSETSESGTAISGESGKLLKSYDWILNSLGPLATHRGIQLDLPPQRNTAASLLVRWFRAIPKTVIVSPEVTRFSAEFRNGVNDPTAAFDLEKKDIPGNFGLRSSNRAYSLAEITVPGNSGHLIDSWLAVPRERRIFVTGARSDAFYAQKLKERYQAEGFIVFFYKFCSPLCRESTVGAFFGTSGEVVHVGSPEAERSQFVPVEVGLISEVTGTGRKLLVIDASQLTTRALEDGHMVRATLFDCPIDPAPADDLLCAQIPR